MASAMARNRRTASTVRRKPSAATRAGLGQSVAEPAQRFLVEARQGRAAELVVDDEADRVGADVDHAVGRTLETPGAFRLEVGVPAGPAASGLFADVRSACLLTATSSGDHAWAGSRPVRSDDLGEVARDRDQVGQGGLRVLAVLGGVGLEALDIDPQGGAGGAGAGQAVDDARAVREQDADALVLADRAVDRVGVGEVVGGRDLEGAQPRAGQGRELAAQMRPSARWRRPRRPPRSRAASSSCGRSCASARGRSSSTGWRRAARMLSQSSTAHSPSFSRTWSEPVPALSSPQIVAMPASSRLPKNFQPVGVSKQGMPSFCGHPVGGAAGRHRAGDALEAAA